METAIYIGGAILFFVLIMASIALHEVGHLVPAKLFGVKTTQYFVGFGRTLWSTRRGETEYGFKLIPLGGFVKMIGMIPPGKRGLRSNSTGMFTSLIDDARSADDDQITDADEGRLFYQKPSWQKLIVMVGGPLMNILLAFGLLLSVNASIGMVRETLVISNVSECMIPADRQEQTCQAGDQPTPAAEAGLEVGDRILAFNATPVDSWSELSAAIRGNLDGPAAILVERDGQQLTLQTRTAITAVSDPLDPSRTLQAGFLGVSPSQERVPGGPVETLQDMGSMTQRVARVLANFPVRVWHVVADLVTGQERDPNGPMSIVGASRVAGEIASTDQIPASEKVAGLVTTLGTVNLFVALFNFVPLLPLDGGHIAGALVEWARRGIARLRRRPDPGPVDIAVLMPVAYLVAGFIALCGGVLIIADIIDPVSLFTP
ncbi:MAG TPA: site-2 protease family protein [Candidatus Avipropionibacterium avicola]|uniref:Site-2 protease family protein n=1 Tax=Candidatus Avipropionibacterium avicola TaxID=2840701 RepID=A0A9D1KP12_9ACTN|nr:site-2 protease family protein [Candidatus Avipropionibacterium avicola]